MPKGKFIDFYATWGWDVKRFPIAFLTDNYGYKLLIYNSSRLEPATLWLQGTEHISIPPHPIKNIIAQKCWFA